MGRREGDREHTWGGGERKGEGEGVNRERVRQGGMTSGGMGIWIDGFTFCIITRYQ